MLITLVCIDANIKCTVYMYTQLQQVYKETNRLVQLHAITTSIQGNNRLVQLHAITASIQWMRCMLHYAVCKYAMNACMLHYVVCKYTMNAWIRLILLFQALRKWGERYWMSPTNFQMLKFESFPSFIFTFTQHIPYSVSYQK